MPALLVAAEHPAGISACGQSDYVEDNQGHHFGLCVLFLRISYTLKSAAQALYINQEHGAMLRSGL